MEFLEKHQRRPKAVYPYCLVQGEKEAGEITEYEIKWDKFARSDRVKSKEGGGEVSHFHSLGSNISEGKIRSFASSA